MEGRAPFAMGEWPSSARLDAEEASGEERGDRSGAGGTGW